MPQTTRPARLVEADPSLAEEIPPVIAEQIGLAQSNCYRSANDGRYPAALLDRD
jgi:hypothetical protein